MRETQEELTDYILKGGLDLADDGLPMETLLTFENVQEIKVLSEWEGRGAGANIMQLTVETTDGIKTWFSMSGWWAGGDDGDHWINIFDTKPKAIKSLEDYKAAW